jgi:DUF1680 family protein
MVDGHAYPTGAVGGRWLDEAVGKPFELPDAMSYAESCAAVAATRLSRQIWRLTGDPRALDQVELLLWNAVPCGVGADGATWFYSQPQAVAEVAGESNPWVTPFDYGPNMALQWFPSRRHEWFDVLCCPPNLARLFATVPHHVADVDGAGDLQIHLPIAATIRGQGWDVEVSGAYPDDGDVRIEVRAAPVGRRVLVREPGWAGGSGPVALPSDGRVDVPVTAEWWESDRRVEGAAQTAYLRRGPVVHCVEGVDLPGVDLRDLVVDCSRPLSEAFGLAARSAGSPLHHPVVDPVVVPVPSVRTVPYHAWSNRGPTTMRIRFPRR